MGVAPQHAEAPRSALFEDVRPLAGDPLAIYAALRERPEAAALADPFTAHVFACVIAIGLRDAARDGASLCASVGLGRGELAALFSKWLPPGLRQIALAGEPLTAEFDDEEQQLRDLLQSFQADESAEANWLASIVTRRSMSDNHLWQDLGLIERAELTRLMAERFPELATRNSGNMKWKKFFYRSLCEMEGFSLCAAPTCRECGDFDSCFGDESGESALARIRRDAPRPA